MTQKKISNGFYRTQIQQVQTSVMVKRALPNILTKALAASKSQEHSPLKDSTYPSWQTPGKPYCRVKNQPLALNRSQQSEARAVLMTPKPLQCMASKKTLKYFRKTLDNSGESWYINKAPEEKRFTEPRIKGKKLNLEKRIVWKLKALLTSSKKSR